MKATKTNEILTQSQEAFKQWGEQWQIQAHAHATDKCIKNNLLDFEHCGIGKAVLCVGNGYSLEENIDIIRELQHKVDIMCCDKTLGHLLDNGIAPTYCVVADANVKYSYLEKWKDQLQHTTLFMNVCGNPEWSKNGNWKNKYFLINKDIIKSEEIFYKITQCPNVIMAATNVSNAMIVLLTQCGDNQPRNFFGYDKILLIGFDYSWKFGGKYYAFDETGDGKSSYMKHMYINTPAGNFAYTSGNLFFSFKWISDYINGFRLPVIQCAPDSLLQTGKTRDLREQMNYEFKPHHSTRVKGLVKRLRGLMQEKQQIDELLGTIGNEHVGAFRASI